MVSEKSAIHRLTYWAFSAGMIWVLLLMVLTAFDVASRYFFSKPVPGAIEVSGLMLAVFGMLGMAYTEHVGANVKVRILESVLPPRVMSLLDSLTTLLSLAIMLLLVYQSGLEGIEEYQYKTATDTLKIPVYPFYFLLAGAGLVLAVELLMSLIGSLRRSIAHSKP